MAPKDGAKYSRMIWIGVLLAAVFWAAEALIHHLVFREKLFPDALLPRDPNEFWMRSFISFLFIAFGFYANFIITKLKESEAERLLLHRRLEEALTKLLSGFIPICAECKKIRDESGKWMEIESYVESRTEAKFSHSICPECSKTVFPDFVQKSN